MKSRIDERDFREIAEKLGLDLSTVRSVITSYFSVISEDARKLPFNTPERIYTKEAFDSLARVHSLPYLGRIGPVYSRYRAWRRNESMTIEQVPRSRYRRRITQSDLENIAEALLSGKTPPPIKKRKPREMFNNVWLVGVDGKKLARQVIPKDIED